MLRDTLFKIIESDHSAGVINATLDLNKNSEIFTGHFPGHPVLPGACMLQIVKEILESTINTPLRLKKADQIKFPGIIAPGINSMLQLTITYKPTDNNKINVTANITVNKGICFKFQGNFIAL